MESPACGRQERPNSTPLGRMVQYDMEALKIWHDSYLLHHYVELRHLPLLVENELDPKRVEQRIQDEMNFIKVTNGFCSHCQYILYHWPSTTNPREKAERTIALQPNSYVLEAAMKNGCRLCTLIVRRLETLGDLNPLRVIEQRCQYLGGGASILIMIFETRISLCLPDRAGTERCDLVQIYQSDNVESRSSIFCHRSIDTDFGR